jgi:hypothetical protein
MSLLIDVVLWTIVAVLALMAAVRSRSLLRDSVRAGALDFLRLLPRILIGVVGAGFLAEILPQSLIVGWLGPGSGLTGTAIASLAGALTPGGPVIGLALGAAALKSGAGAPQVIAYATAWALFAFPRLIMFELPSMQARAVWIRVLVSLPLPFIAAAGAMLIGRP